MEINYNGYERGIEELAYMRMRHIPISPVAAIKVNSLRREGKHYQANALEYEKRFGFYMKMCEKDWHYYDPRGEQSLSQYAHDSLGQAYFSWKEQEQGRGR